MQFTLKNKDDIIFFITFVNVTTDKIQVDLFQPNTEYKDYFFIETSDLIEITKICTNAINEIDNLYK